jgi:hypothetical protein
MRLQLVKGSKQPYKQKTRKDDLCDSQNNYLSDRYDDSDNDSIINEINA